MLMTLPRGLSGLNLRTACGCVGQTVVDQHLCEVRSGKPIMDGSQVVDGREPAAR